MRKKSVSIVISAFDEERNIPALYSRLSAVIKRLPVSSAEIIFVDDGSKDGTYRVCHQLFSKDKSIKIVRLSRNFGHEIAMTAGMNAATGDGVVFMDADGQHPPEYIPRMVELWQKGADIVLMRRQDDLDKSAAYKFLSRQFYKVLNFLSNTPVMNNTPDFRLIDKKYVHFLKQFNERDRLFRGLLGWIQSDNIACIDFTAPKRMTGTTKYNFWKSLNLALDSIVQLSVKPLYLSLILAVITGVISLFLGIHVIIEYFFLSHRTPGYATIMTTVFFMGSLQLFMFAILGAYIAKIHLEVKKRPLYYAEITEKKRK